MTTVVFYFEKVSRKLFPRLAFFAKKNDVFKGKPRLMRCVVGTAGGR